MAGAGGTGPQKPAQPDQLEQIREALVQAITQHLSGPEPTAPQYQPTPISPMQGYAIARNPQAAGLINQTIQAPGQARYMQQQAAFEQAMAGRHQAMNAGVALLGQEQRQQINPLDILRLQETMRHNQATENKPTSESAPKTAYDASGNLIEYDLKSGRWKPAVDASGNRIQKQPTDAEATARTAFVTTKKNLELLKQMAMAPASGGLMGRVGATSQRLFSHVPGNEMFSSQANVNDYNALVNDLGTQLRAIYGAQGIRAFQEIQLLLKNVPPYGSSPELIQQRFGKIDEIVTLLEQERQRMQPSAFPSTVQQPVDAKALAEEYMRKYGKP